MTREETVPEFCPQRGCYYYWRAHAAGVRWYDRHGSFHSRSRGRIQRFRCRRCGKTCSTQTFSIHYWTHSSEDHRLLLQKLCCGSGLRQHARCSGRSLGVVRNRVRRLARNCLAVLDAAESGHVLAEDLAMDGFESFTRSQYFPNNITMIVGAGSQYIYGAVHTLLRRKGRMTARQRALRSIIDRHWCPPRGAVRTDVTSLLEDASAMICGGCSGSTSITIATDLHRAYPAALAAVPALARARAAGTLRQLRISSRAARTVHNRLFPVNYVDREIRKCLGEHVRETLKHGREVNCQMERMAIFMVAHNFLTPHRIRDGVQALTHAPTRARVAGLAPAAYKPALRRLFTHRSIYGHCRGRSQWRGRIWAHRYDNPPAVDPRTESVSPQRVALSPGELPRHLLA